MQVKVYRNLHKKCFSIQGKYGLVVDHADTVSLMAVTFTVQKAGRQRVIDSKKKNVHAFAIGERLYSNKLGVYDNSFTKIYYNPYKYGFFHTEAGLEVSGCALLVLNSQGMFAKGILLAK